MTISIPSLGGQEDGDEAGSEGTPPLKTDVSPFEYEGDITREASETETRMVWQLLGNLGDAEVLVTIFNWLAEENTDHMSGSIPGVFIGRIEEESETTIRLADSADATSLMSLAHRIHSLEQAEDEPDRDEWFDRTLWDQQREFKSRAGSVRSASTLTGSWRPISRWLHGGHQGL